MSQVAVHRPLLPAPSVAFHQNNDTSAIPASFWHRSMAAFIGIYWWNSDMRLLRIYLHGFNSVFSTKKRRVLGGMLAFDSFVT